MPLPPSPQLMPAPQGAPQDGMQGGPPPELLAMLLGGGSGMAPQMGMPPPSPVDANAQMMRQFMELDQQVDMLAREFPQAAQGARMVKDGLKEMLVSIVSVQPGVDAAPAPRAI